MNELVAWGSDSGSRPGAISRNNQVSARVPSVTGSSVLTSLKGDHIWEFLVFFP